MTTVVAERELDFFGERGREPGLIRLYCPEPDQDDVRCAYHIAWPGFERRHRIVGIDSLQALTLALQMVGSVIAATDDFKNGRIGVFGEVLDLDDLKRMLGIGRLPGFETP